MHASCHAKSSGYRTNSSSNSCKKSFALIPMTKRDITILLWVIVTMSPLCTRSLVVQRRNYKLENIFSIVFLLSSEERHRLCHCYSCGSLFHFHRIQRAVLVNKPLVWVFCLFLRFLSFFMIQQK